MSTTPQSGRSNGLATEPQDGKLRLRPGDLRPALITALEDVTRYSRSMMRGDDKSLAVHEQRKALRRARSIVRMLRPTLSNRVLRQIEPALREAHRRHASRRDFDARAAAWALFADRHHLIVPAAEAVLGSNRPVSRRSGADRGAVDGALRLLAERLPPSMTTDDLRRGLKATYRAAREARKRIANVADPSHVHALRRRCKDLHNQLELIESIAPKRATKWRKRFGRLAKDLGDITDLYMVQSGLDEVWRRHPELGPKRKRRIDRLIDTDVQRKLRTVLKRCKKALGKKPKPFAARLNL